MARVQVIQRVCVVSLGEGRDGDIGGNDVEWLFVCVSSEQGSQEQPAQVFSSHTGLPIKQTQYHV
jgi:hypothetical protein